MSPEQLNRLANLTSEELRQAQMRIVLRGLVQCQEKLQAGGVRHSWLDPYIQIARDEAQPMKPIDMVLHCPACGLQHIDAPKPCDMGMGCEHAGVCYANAVGQPERCPAWDNPPHRSHLCHGCGHIWRPADVPTNGVQAVKNDGEVKS